MSKRKEFVQQTISWAKKKPKLDAEGKEIVESKDEKKSMFTTGEYGSLELILTPAWREIFKNEFVKEYFGKLIEFLNGQHSIGKQIFPPKQLIFEAFNCCPLGKIKVVILGQDPFHTRGAPCGLSFSVPPTEPIPPSLVTIFREIKSDMAAVVAAAALSSSSITSSTTAPSATASTSSTSITPAIASSAVSSSALSAIIANPEAKEYKSPANGCLRRWADQGVLLLNSTLTVNEGEPNSHESSGWSQFTDTVVKYLSSKGTHIVFMLWGSFAQKKASGVDQKKHCILKAPHPSPRSPGSFLGCKHFSKANIYLRSVGKDPIIW